MTSTVRGRRAVARRLAATRPATQQGSGPAASLQRAATGRVVARRPGPQHLSGGRHRASRHALDPEHRRDTPASTAALADNLPQPAKAPANAGVSDSPRKSSTSRSAVLTSKAKPARPGSRVPAGPHPRGSQSARPCVASREPGHHSLEPGERSVDFEHCVSGADRDAHANGHPDPDPDPHHACSDPHHAACSDPYHAGDQAE